MTKESRMPSDESRNLARSSSLVIGHSSFFRHWSLVIRHCPTSPLLLAVLDLVFFLPLVLHPTQVLYSDHSDLIAEHIPAKRFLVRSWQETGEVPLWCPYHFAGAPFVHDIQVAPFYPLHLPLYLLPETRVGAAVSWLIVLHVLL